LSRTCPGLCRKVGVMEFGLNGVDPQSTNKIMQLAQAAVT